MEKTENKKPNHGGMQDNPEATAITGSVTTHGEIKGTDVQMAIRDEVTRFMRHSTDSVKEAGLLSLINQAITDKVLITTKEVLNSEEAARYIGISTGTLHKLTHNRALPYYKPSGKLCFFNRRELEAWLQRNRISSNDEIADRAYTIAMRGGKR